VSKKSLMATAALTVVSGCAVQNSYETDELYGYPVQQQYYYGPAYGTVYGGTIWYQDEPDRRRYYTDRNHNGIPDARETDRNHNGIPDYKETAPPKSGNWSRPPARKDATPNSGDPRRDLDRDGIPNRRDADRDGDGTPNSRDRYPNDRDRK
jgi:hypothetical protein